MGGSGDIARLVTQQPGDQSDDLGGVGLSVHGPGREIVGVAAQLAHGIDCVAHRARECSGRDGIDAYALAHGFEGGGIRQADDGSLGTAIQSAASRGPHGTNRRDVDNRPASPLLQHLADARAQPEEHASHIHRVDLLELLQRGLVDASIGPQQADSSLTNVELARRVHLSASPCLMRVKALEASGVIQRYVALTNPKALGLGLKVFISISLKEQSKAALAKFESRITEHDEVMECYLMTGDSDYLIRVAVADIKALENFILEQLSPIPGIEKIRSSFALKQVRYKTALPLPVYQAQ